MRKEVFYGKEVLHYEYKWFINLIVWKIGKQIPNGLLLVLAAIKLCVFPRTKKNGAERTGFSTHSRMRLF